MSSPVRIDVSVPPGRGIYCNRTLNLRAIKAIGYDMDYTLIHYNVEAWERLAYEYIQQKLLSLGWPVDDLEFDPSFVIRGLIIDKELGNIVKANRFGYVKRARHGRRFLDYPEQRRIYSRTVVDLAEPRWDFLNTFFSLSEGCMYAQMVDALDAGLLPGVHGYADLYEKVRTSLDEAHMEGQLKAQIMANPERFVDRDPDTAAALLDQRDAGKKTLLITNSGWTYTRHMMSWTFDPVLPDGMTWRDLFDVVIVSAAKPAFFGSRQPLFEVVDDEGLLRPVERLASGCYLGGTAGHVEQYLGCSGSDILYMGDHIYADVHVSKGVRRWRTGLIVRELEEELSAVLGFAPQQAELDAMMARKVALEFDHAQLRLELQRLRAGRPLRLRDTDPAALQAALDALRQEIAALDAEIAPLAVANGELSNPAWGLLMRTGNDKSHLARQVERHADIYTSRVSNLLFETPFVYLRSNRGSLPHDPVFASSRGTGGARPDPFVPSSDTIPES